MRPERVSTTTRNINPQPAEIGEMRTEVGEQITAEPTLTITTTPATQSGEPQQLQFDKEADERFGIGSARDPEVDKLADKRSMFHHANPIDDPEEFGKRVTTNVTEELTPESSRQLETTIYKPKQTGARFGFTEEFQQEGPNVLNMLKKVQEPPKIQPPKAPEQLESRMAGPLDQPLDMSRERPEPPRKVRPGKEVVRPSQPGSSTDPLPVESEDFTPASRPAGDVEMKDFGGLDLPGVSSATEEAGAEAGAEAAAGAEGVGEAVAEAEAAVAPVDEIPGVGAIAAAGAAIYGVGEAFGWFGGHKSSPIPTEAHIQAPATFQVASNNINPSYRSFQKAYAAPTINSGIMR